MRNLSALLVVMLFTVFLCTACGEKNIVNTLEKMYDEGIKEIEMMESAEDVQSNYDKIIAKIKEFKTAHHEELSALDSTTNTLQEIEEAFIKACCKKSAEFNSGLLTDYGYVRLDENGNIFIDRNPNEIESNTLESSPNNPLNIIGYSYICLNGNIEYITLQTPYGPYLYNEEDAEQYYDNYVLHFFFANMIVKRIWYSDAIEETKKYVRDHLFDIVSNLPVDINSYPKDVVERVNKIYFNYMGKAQNLHLSRRSNGVSIYNYGGPTKLYINRDPEHGGRLIIYDL